VPVAAFPDKANKKILKRYDQQDHKRELLTAESGQLIEFNPSINLLIEPEKQKRSQKSDERRPIEYHHNSSEEYFDEQQ
jgi:hypothetical protein